MFRYERKLKGEGEEEEKERRRKRERKDYRSISATARREVIEFIEFLACKCGGSKM